MGLLFEPGYQSACSLQYDIEIVNPEEQEETVARPPLVRAHQGRMVVHAPLVKAKQDGSIRIEDLAPAVMDRTPLGLAKERLVPFEATRNVIDADDRPSAFHGGSLQRLVRRTTVAMRLFSIKSGASAFVSSAGAGETSFQS